MCITSKNYYNECLRCHYLLDYYFKVLNKKRDLLCVHLVFPLIFISLYICVLQGVSSCIVCDTNIWLYVVLCII